MSNNSRFPRVYLAGPGVFRPDARAYGDHLKALCSKAGLEGLYPLDNEIMGSSPQDVAAAIYTANVALIDKADAVIADISPFRGPNMDPGTAWEIGYGCAKGLPIVLWSSNRATLLERTQESEGVAAQSGRDFLDAAGMTIENFGLVENLMIAVRAETIHGSADEAIAACAALRLG